MKIISVDDEYLKKSLTFRRLRLKKETYSDSGMVMTLQLTRMVVIIAKPNIGWVKTVSAMRRTG